MSENNNDKNRSTFSVLDIILVLLKNKLMIFLITFAGMVFILGISVLSLILPPGSPFNYLPNIYRPKAKILIALPSEAGGKLSAVGRSREVSTILGMMGEGAVSPNVGKFVKDLLDLNEIRDKIIDEFNFIERYNIRKFPQTTAREVFKKKMALNLEETIITLGFEDTDPVFATNVLKRVIEEVISKYSEITHGKISKKVVILKESLKITEQNYKKIQDKFIAFQKEHGIIDISFQAKQSIDHISSLKANLAKKELELIKLLEYYSEDDPKVIRKKKDIETARQVIAETEKGIGIYSDQFLPQDIIPELTREYLNLELELNIQAAIYRMLREQYEATRIEELDTTDRFEILETAEIPERKIKPSRVSICIIFTISVFFLSILLAFLREYLRNAKKNPGEREKLSNIKTEIFIFKLFNRKKQFREIDS